MRLFCFIDIITLLQKAVQIHIFTAAKTVEDGKQKALERKDKEQGQFLELTKTKIMDALLEQSYNIYKTK